MKGQSSMEFLSMISLSMIILASLYSVMAAKQEDTLDYRQERTAERVAEKVSFEAEMALVQGVGYSRVFSLPEGIAGDDYEVVIGDGSVEVNWSYGLIYRLSRYQKEDIKLEPGDSSRVFKVKHNESGVYINAQ